MAIKSNGFTGRKFTGFYNPDVRAIDFDFDAAPKSRAFGFTDADHNDAEYNDCQSYDDSAEAHDSNADEMARAEDEAGFCRAEVRGSVPDAWLAPVAAKPAVFVTPRGHEVGKCGPCNGTGSWSSRFKSGKCYRCNGTGHVDAASAARNRSYDAYARR
jgi:hypothetical protein